MYTKVLTKISCISLILASSLHAISLKDSVEKVLSTNPEVIAEKENQEAFKKYVDENRSAYYPKINLDLKLEKNKVDQEFDGSVADNTIRKDGYNAGITIDQILYDGNTTPSRVAEAKYNDKANKYKSLRTIDGIVLESITSYTDLVKYTEFLKLTEEMIKTNEDNLQIAKEKEDISGEILETYQVSSKLSFLKDQYIEEQDQKSTRESAFKRFIGIKASGKECRPSINEALIPKSLQKAAELTVLNNHEILEQIERIKVQREKIAQNDASFLPNLSLQLKASKDDDLSLDERGEETEVYGQINLSWNLYNGGSNKIKTKQEKIFLAEEKKRLEAISNKALESVKVNYQRYYKNKQRVEVLKSYVKANANVVDVYKNEFEAGTRTFVDILNAQIELYQAKKSLVTREYELYANYYSILNSLSILSNSVLESSSQCAKDNALVKVEEVKIEVKKESKKEENEDLTALFEETEVEKEEVKTEVKKEVVRKTTSSSGENVGFLDVNKKAYTINVATTNGINKANTFVRNNNLDKNNSYTYSFGANMSKAKVIYGIFNSVKEAKAAIKTLPSNIRKSGPYVDNINKHKKLYKKYH